MLNIGLDAVEITRFQRWSTYSKKQLQKIFSQEELQYAFTCPSKTAERLALRFAAKEATYKALTPFFLQPIHFRSAARYISVQKNVTGAPHITLNRQKLPLCTSIQYNISLTASHTKTLAICAVIIFSLDFS